MVYLIDYENMAKESLIGYKYLTPEDGLYLPSLKQFGRERGTRRYANIRDIER